MPPREVVPQHGPARGSSLLPPRRLVGREAELAGLLRRLEDADRRRGSAVVLSGEAGIGKSALAGQVSALTPSMVARVHGLAGGLPAPLAAVESLVGQLGGVAAAATGDAAPGDAGRRHRRGQALARLCDAVESLGRTVLLVVDDAAALDTESCLVLRQLAAEVEAMPVVLLVTVRTEEVTRFHDLPRVELPPLTRAEAGQLLASHRLGSSALDSCWRVCGGNPLALLSLAPLLTPGQRATGFGVAEIARLLSDPVRLHAARLQGVAATDRDALRLLALDDTERLDPVARAAGRPVQELAARLDRYPKVVVVDATRQRASFVHPLLRSAAAAGGAATLRGVHERLAEAYDAHGDVLRATWHRALATDGDDEVAERLARVAGNAAVATDVAGRVLEQAARTASAAQLRGRLLLAAGEQLSRLGTVATVTDLLEEALDLPLSDERRARAAVLLASQEFVTRSAEAAIRRLVALAAEPRTRDADRPELLLLASLLAALDFDHARAHALTVQARRATPPRDELLRDVLQAIAEVATWQAPPATSVPALAALARGADHRSPTVRFAVAATLAVLTGTFSGTGVALGEYERTVGACRLPGAPALEWFGAVSLCLEALRCGRWHAVYLRAVEEGGSWGSALPAGWGWILGRVWLAAALGHVGDARRDVAAAVAAAERGPSRLVHALAMAARLFVETADEDWAAAVRTGAWLRRWQDATTSYDAWRWSPNYLEALARSGHRAEAEAEAVTMLAQAGAFPQWAWEAAARCRALLADSPEAAVAAATAAVAIGRDRHDPLELARSLLVEAEVRRRHGRPHEVPLAEARELVQRLGAAGPWARRVARLTEGGDQAHGTPGDRGRPGGDLTRAEYRVAAVVAQGATNREAAARLHLSAKTVDTHLGHIYRKLGLRNRTELARAIGRDTEPEGAG